MLKPLDLSDNAPWKQRFRAAEIYISQIASQNPAQGILANNLTGAQQWYAWDVPTGALRQLTFTPGGHAEYLFLSPDGRWVYTLDDKQGDEIGHYVRFPIAGGEAQDITPDLPLYASWGFHISRNGRRICFMAAFDNTFNIYCLDVAEDGSLTHLRNLCSSPRMLLGPLLAYEGDVLTIMSTERTGKPQYSLVSFDALTGEKINELWEGGENSLEMMVASPLPGETRLLASTTRTGIETLLIWDPRTGERQDLALEVVTGSVRAFDWSPDGKSILFRTLNAAVQQLYLYHLPTRQTTRLRYPPGTNFGPYFTPGGDEIISHWQSSTQPTSLIALSPSTGEALRTVISAGEAPPGHAWKSVAFLSTGGQPIQGWLALPDGDGPYPTVIETHGGPTSVQGNAYLPGSQAWLDHGFAYLTINYRGSTTFGRDFEQSIWGQPGRWEVDDIVAGRNWLVEGGISSPDAIFLTGWSYGGYLTLLGMGKAPELWAGGMAGIAIADWAMSYEDSAETLRGYQVSLFGGTPAEKPEQYRLSSPITYAEQVRAPVLIIQGRNDTRTPARPVEAYEARLKSLGKEIEVHWYDTGHAGSFTSMDQAIRSQELMLKFAYRVLG